MTNIVTVHARKGGVGKTRLSYELAFLLGAVLVDFDYEAGNATGTWGWNPKEHDTSPILRALETGRTPRPLSGFRKPDLLPGHPDFVMYDRSSEELADAVEKWASDWGREWVVIDTHNGASPATNAALRAANLVLAPVPLAYPELRATQQLVDELADYPLVLIPSMVGSVPKRLVDNLTQIVEGTPVQVGPLVPKAEAVKQRSRRIAITAEETPAKSLRSVKAAMEQVASFVKEYLNA
jgi:chromosome partitioning protein